MKEKRYIVGQVVWFQVYKENEPIQGRIKRKGNSIELGVNWDKTDKRLYYELESIGEKQNFVFTRTTAQWLSETKQPWVRPEI